MSIIEFGGGASASNSEVVDPTSADWHRIDFTHCNDVVNANNMLSAIYNAGASGASSTYDSSLLEADKPGVFRVGSGTSSAWARIWTMDNASIEIGTTAYVQSALFKLSAVPDATDDFEFGIGFADNVLGSATDLVFLGADRSINATNFSVNVGDGTYSTADTGVAMDTSWHVAQVYMTSTECRFYLDGSLVHTETTNLPTGDIAAYGATYRWIAGAAQYGAVDWCALDYKPAASTGSWFDITGI